VFPPFEPNQDSISSPSSVGFWYSLGLMSKKHLTNVSFGDFGLPAKLMQGIEEAGFSSCTPVQAETLPLVLKGKDVAGQAQTGTGKTAAFLIGLFSHLLRHPASEKRRLDQPRAFILAPTRELAIQIHRDAELLGKQTGLTLGLAYGGTDYVKQREHLEQGVDVLIGTPGRLIDFFKQRVFDLMALQVVVLDEADRMFDLGFISDIRYLFRRMPKPESRLNMLFSATLSLRVTELAYEHMNAPQAVEIAPKQVTADKVAQVIYYPALDEKIPLLLGLLKHYQPTRAIIFVNTKKAGDTVWSYLKGNDIEAAILSGDVPQRKRQRLLIEFEKGAYPVLVATDVAARGLHIPEVTHVFNYDLPQDAEDYVHRIGRTARAGSTGTAVSFGSEDYVFSLMDIQEYIGQKIPSEPVTADLMVEPKPPAARPRRSGGPPKGRRSRGKPSPRGNNDKRGGKPPRGRRPPRKRD